MSIKVERTEILSREISSTLNELYFRKTGQFWANYLSSQLSQYNFYLALIGAKVTPETVTAIIAAYDEDIKRISELLKKAI